MDANQFIEKYGVSVAKVIARAHSSPHTSFKHFTVVEPFDKLQAHAASQPGGFSVWDLQNALKQHA